MLTNISKLKSLLGWRRKVELEAGIKGCMIGMWKMWYNKIV